MQTAQFVQHTRHMPIQAPKRQKAGDTADNKKEYFLLTNFHILTPPDFWQFQIMFVSLQQKGKGSASRGKVVPAAPPRPAFLPRQPPTFPSTSIL